MMLQVINFICVIIFMIALFQLGIVTAICLMKIYAKTCCEKEGIEDGIEAVYIHSINSRRQKKLAEK